jgi:hypothetical protein
MKSLTKLTVTVTFSSVMSGLVLGVDAPRAWACSCAPAVAEVVAPREGATEVPLNTLIWVRFGDEASEAPTLADANQNLIGLEPAGTLTGRNGPQVGAYQPTQELAAGTAYKVAFGQLTASFTTGAATDVDPPPPPAVITCTEQRSPQMGATSSCGDYHYRSVSAVSTGVVVLARLAGESFDDASRTGEVAVLDVPGGAASQVDLLVGKSPCDGTTWSGKAGDSTRLQLASYDSAGSFSGWGEQQTVALGCAGAPSGRGLGWLLLALGAARLLLVKCRGQRVAGLQVSHLSQSG